MARLIRVMIVVLVSGAAAIGVAPMAQAKRNPTNTTSWDAIMQDNSGTVNGTHGSALSANEPIKKSSGTRTLTSYQPICDYIAAASRNLSLGDAWAISANCHRSSDFCPRSTPEHPLTAAWVMQAPASPRPGPDDWRNTGHTICLSARQAAPGVVVTAEQFRRLPIPGPVIITQPPDRVTLINIGTNFLTRKEAVILPTTVLGQAVRVRATPASYAWKYGDGGWLTTADPGGFYPNMPTAHVFTVPGTYQVGLTTTFTGEFSVGGGPWQPINGTAAAPSRPATITAQERRAVLIK